MMQLKRFVAPSMSQALKLVREEVGPDAIILSNKRVAGGVELVTAIEQLNDDASFVYPADMQPGRSKAKNLSPAATASSKLEREVDRMQQQAKQRAATLAATLGRSEQHQFAKAMAKAKAGQGDSQSAHTKACAELDDSNVTSFKPQIDNEQQQRDIQLAVAAAVAEVSKSQQLTNSSDDQVEQMRMELQAMRHMMQQQMSSMAWGQFAASEPEKASLWRRLKRMGISPILADKLLKAMPELSAEKHVWMQLMQNLTKELPVLGEDLLAGSAVLAFVGPTGAGKTTTIAKLAASYVMANGAEDIALVTTDTYRIAAHEQLRTVGRILNVPVKIVDKQNPLDRVLYSLRHKKRVLIDTAGLTHQDQRLIKQTQSINELADKVKTVLVLPATSQPQVLRAAYHHYKTDNLFSCILTKLDETASLGECISLSVEKSLPIAYSTNGQNIPDDIAIAESAAMVRLAIELAKDQQVDEADMGDELQALIS